MEEELLLKQPTDRRLGSDKTQTICDGPPGADEYETKAEEKTKTPASKSSRRKSPSPSSSSSKRKASPQRGRRSPSSPPSSRNRHRSPTPPARNRNRFRYSPDRRGSRFDRRRSPAPRDRDRSRYRGGRSRRDNSDSRSRSRSASPQHSRRGSTRWSSKNKANSPSPTPKPSSTEQTNTSHMMRTPAGVMQHPPPTGQYGMMQPQTQQLYGTDTYAAAYGNAYAMPNTYSMPPTANYSAVYPQAANPWGTHDAYAQQTWMQPQTVVDPNSQINQQTEQVPLAASNNFAAATKSSTSAEKAPVSVETSAAHDAAVAKEAENQREELKKQRSSYIKKNSLLKKELRMLKDQRKDLGSGSAPLSPTTKGFVDENEKLQDQIQKKIATIENVIEMLTGVIGEEHVAADRKETATTKTTATTSAAPTASSATATAKASVVRTVDKKDSSKVTPKPVNNSVLKGNSQAKNDQSKTASAASSKSSRDVASSSKTRGPTTTSSDTSSSSGSSSSSGGSSSSSEEEEENSKKIETIVIREEDDDSSPERLKHKAIESMKSKQRAQVANVPHNSDKGKSEKTGSEKKEPSRFNYAFYDPEMHWCQRCNVFPKTAKDYLNHLHSIEHMKKETTPETPWHAILVEDNFPTYENAPMKRMPIRGITFFAPATAWYCKLCSIWMGDLHCASVHLKSKLHSKKYSGYLDRNPNFEMNWLADRQRVLNLKNQEAATAQQITAVSTTAAVEREEKKSKKLEEKANKKSKKSSEKKDKKKKKKRNKKHKKAKVSSSESSTSDEDDSSSSDETENEEKKKKKIPKEISPIKELDNANPASSIRVTMRNNGNNAANKIANDEALPPQPAVTKPPQPSVTLGSKTNVTGLVQSNNWSVIQEGTSKAEPNQNSSYSKTDDTMMQQWNTVQPVISDNEKKMLEQLKGKLKTTKPGETSEKDTKDAKEASKSDLKDSRDSRGERSGDNRRGERGTTTDRYRGRRSRSRSRTPTRSRSRGKDYRLARSRSLRRRSRSRGRRSPSRGKGRYSPIRRGSRRRRSRSRSRRRRSRSRSRNRRNRRSRTRSGSRGKGSQSSAAATNKTLENSLLQHSEFRPRVPEKDKEKEKEKDKKAADSKERKESKKLAKAAAAATTNGNSAGNAGKKLPFIGKMPVFKKQASGQAENESMDCNFGADMSVQNLAAIYMSQAGAPPPPPPPRKVAPTAAQINMAMMEDVYGNAPPFHPEAGVMENAMDYDDLMPDPVQFVNIMAQAPPPPGEESANDDEEVLPPGIDSIETEEFVPKPIPVEENDGNLPKDLEEALNIIFPGERKPEDDEDAQAARDPGETQIIVEEPVMQMHDLYKEGIHLVSIEETSLMAMDEASRLSMNEPLVFKKASSSVATNGESKKAKTKEKEKEAETEKATSKSDKQDKNTTEAPSKKDEINKSIELEAIVVPDEPKKPNDEAPEKAQSEEKAADEQATPPAPAVKADENSFAALDFSLDDIPHPPAPLTESEKKRRQEELEELAMLGIDADDMAAQRM